MIDLINEHLTVDETFELACESSIRNSQTVSDIYKFLQFVYDIDSKYMYQIIAIWCNHWNIVYLQASPSGSPDFTDINSKYAFHCYSDHFTYCDTIYRYSESKTRELIISVFERSE